MTPFDQAWALLKMPIVPHSLRQTNRGEDDEQELYEALFDDPVTGERHKMTGSYKPQYRPKTLNGIGSLDPMLEVDHDEIDSRAVFTHEPFYEGSKNMRARGVETHPDYRRRGYATALYDMAADSWKIRNTHCSINATIWNGRKILGFKNT